MSGADPPRIDVGALISAHQLRPKKALGQSFLHERGVLARIAAAARETGAEWVVEIGAGLGSLTAELVREGLRVAAIERDAALLPILRDTFSAYPAVQLVHGDAAALRYRELVPPGVRPAVAGNLPYSISSPLLLHLLSQRREIGPAVVMIQRELADRLTATPGSKDYGSLTVLFALFADVEALFDVGPGAFTPPPKVHSTVLRIDWRSEPRAAIPGEREMEGVVRAAFSQRRKTLLNSLSSRFPRAEVIAAGAKAGVMLNRRAETLTVSEFAALAWALSPGPAPVSG